MIAQTVARRFEERYGRKPRVALAPGRVNLIGEHTDYNEGYVFPVAIDRYAAAAFAPNEENVLRGYSTEFDEERVSAIDELSPSPVLSWYDYAGGVAWAFRESGLAVPGMDFVVGGNIPIGAGLSSSAAFELAVARAIGALSSDGWDPTRSAKLAQRAENEYVGVPCGIMDQMAAALSETDSAMLLDCRYLTIDSVPLPKDTLVVVMDTGTRRSLADSPYDERRWSCEEAVRVLAETDPSISALRDVTLDALEASRERMTRTTYLRALHVVKENQRALEMVEALRASDLKRVGDLMALSHENLRNLYEVSSPPLDQMVGIATRHPACIGARMTGAGFGGCAVALVEAAGAKSFVEEVEATYRKDTGEPGSLFACRAVSGARVLNGDERA